MLENLTKEEIRQVWFDLAHEMEKECGDWQNTPDNPQLTERILSIAKEHLKQKQKSAEKGITIPIHNDQEQMVRNIASLSGKQLNLISRFVEKMKDNTKEQA